MPKYVDSLRGYSFKIHKRDHFRCRYCGLDGTESFANWTSLSCDHLLPHGDPRRETLEFIVTACMFCNTADNQYFVQAGTRNLTFENKSPDELVAQRLPYVLHTRDSYEKFWEDNVRIANSSFEARAQETRQIVLEVGAEGGTLAIVRQRNQHGNWEYWCVSDETTMLDVLPQDEIGDRGDLLEESARVPSFHDALLRLDRYPWYRLYPLKVCAEYAASVLREVEMRGGKEATADWTERLKSRAGMI